MSAARSLLGRLPDAGLVLLAPSSAGIPAPFTNVRIDAGLHEALLGQVQRFRGAVYCTDAAIPAEDLDEQGRYRVPADDHSWQLVALGNGREVLACIRLTWHRPPVLFSALAVRRLLARMALNDGARYEAAVRERIARTDRLGLQFGEVGGTASAGMDSGSARALLLACACWSFGELVGGGLAVAATTMRHHTARILRRLGGAGLAGEDGAELPAFFDPYHGCDMEVLEFDSRRPSRRYAATVADLCEQLRRSPVVASRG